MASAMTEAEFIVLMRRARTLTSDYGSGYQRGLRRCHHGEEFGSASEHLAMLKSGVDGDPRVERGRGYRDGLAGGPPEPALGRPVLAADATRSDKRPRSIRLGDDSWAKLQALGMGWLERQIEQAAPGDES